MTNATRIPLSRPAGTAPLTHVRPGSAIIRRCLTIPTPTRWSLREKPTVPACSPAPASSRISRKPAWPPRPRAPKSSPSPSAAPTWANRPTSPTCSTCCRRIATRSCPIPPAATPPRTRCAPAGWPASCSTATPWSSWKCWATRRPCIRTWCRPWLRPSNWWPTASK